MGSWHALESKALYSSRSFFRRKKNVNFLHAYECPWHFHVLKYNFSLCKSRCLVSLQPNIISISLSFSILARLSEGSLDAKSVSLPPISFFPSLYGYYKKPDFGQIRKTISEPVRQRKKIVKTFRSKIRYLPPIASLYPEDDQEEVTSEYWACALVLKFEHTNKL